MFEKHPSCLPVSYSCLYSMSCFLANRIMFFVANLYAYHDYMTRKWKILWIQINDAELTKTATLITPQTDPSHDNLETTL